MTFFSISAKSKKDESDDAATAEAVTAEAVTNENSAGTKAVCSDSELKALAESIKEYWRKLIPKLGLTTENMKAYEEANSEDAGTYVQV